MLRLNDVCIYLQSFGTVLGIFLVSESKRAIEERYFSFYNHEATKGELEWWSNTCALFWVYSDEDKGSAADKVQKAFTNAILNEILNTQQTKGTNPWPIACRKAQEYFNPMESVAWFKVAAELDICTLGYSVTAEKGTGNFDDDVLGNVVTRKGSSVLDIIKVQQSNGEMEDEEEYVSKGI